MMGLEPTTLGTTNRCSNQLSYIYRFGDGKGKKMYFKVKVFLKLQCAYFIIQLTATL